ncbi:hypothetical protein VIBNISFn27_970159 [Vibrio nigripulchritudo SFn27]|uniref:Uncharacterized protein n=1 Tax=Vibrio nigripulchritudo TaxID=28173 RepID=U4KH60_9VIBR|nr:hypothetical protein [Vibrio nigripulchritudo]CCN81600.1 hypothetical protein VIBNIBLFn1_240158 [Vibrio nigripulchritudo BLFn1]CCN91697.1 hypothetical protein VIBNISFn27_970159 [Vibrio nigripulchritudo SFn27]CCN96581.1 hypothetical protein VIBNIENn2_780158 [Vibrio nigripulchritudo ENn2]CCO38455.1 hypothetical protein VIBNISFn135_100160 [Vibrio nigripulchritudo SFn135]CCO53912.1 hypothetical protein VIBNIWn13_600160 [Vibrio nigripulchritudo Wn13]
MYISILTHNREVPLSSDYINFMYPVDKLFKSCIELRSEAEMKAIPASSIKESSLGGPLRKLPNDMNGEKRFQKVREAIDRSTNVRSTMATDRLHWKNKGVIPSPAHASMAPIQPSSLATNSMKAKGGRAMALGIVLQKGRAMMLYDIIRQNVKILAQRVKNSNPESSGCILVVNIKYLKIEREYGKAPQLSRLSLDTLFSNETKSAFDERSFISNKINSLCEVSAKKPLDNEFSILIGGNSDESYSSAVLFVKCSW